MQGFNQIVTKSIHSIDSIKKAIQDPDDSTQNIVHLEVFTVPDIFINTIYLYIIPLVSYSDQNIISEKFQNSQFQWLWIRFLSKTISLFGQLYLVQQLSYFLLIQSYVKKVPILKGFSFKLSFYRVISFNGKVFWRNNENHQIVLCSRTV